MTAPTARFGRRRALTAAAIALAAGAAATMLALPAQDTEPTPPRPATDGAPFPTIRIDYDALQRAEDQIRQADATALPPAPDSTAPAR